MPAEGKTSEIKKALHEAIISSGANADSEEILERIMTTLDRKKLFRYHNEGEISLISTPGRVLIALLEDGKMTQRALAVYLNLSETMIDKTIKSLIDRGLITKTKLNRQNIYKVNTVELKNHPDIQHFSSIYSQIHKKDEAVTKVTKNITNNVDDDDIF